MPNFPHNPNILRDRSLCVFVHLDSPTSSDEKHLITLSEARGGAFRGLTNGKWVFEFKEAQEKRAFEIEVEKYLKERNV